MASGAVTQLSIPGVLVLLSAPDGGTPVADRVTWQRAVLQSNLSSAAKLVALALASHAGSAAPTAAGSSGPAVCAPGLAVLVTETGYSRTHVQRQLTTLRNCGWLVATSRPASGRPTQFGLSFPDAIARAHGIRDAISPAPRAAASKAPEPGEAGATRSLRPAERAEPPSRPAPAGAGPTVLARRRSRATGTAVSKALRVAGGSSEATIQPAAAPAPARPVEPARAPAPADAAPPAPAPAALAPLRPLPPTGSSAAVANQVLATLARAMRCTIGDFGDAAARLVDILDQGAWSPAALATHLVDFIVGGVMVQGAGPADSLGWRLDRLPRSSGDCACRSCRSWRQCPAGSGGTATASLRPAPSAAAVGLAAPTAPVGPAGPAPAVAAATAPELAAIERAAAAGAAQARLAGIRATA